MRHVAARLDGRWRERARAEWLALWSPRAFDLGDGATEVVAAGAGPALLLLPPLPGWKEAWAASLPLLARRHRVIAFDLRVRFPAGDRWAAWIADAIRVADAFAPGPLTLVGHSLGGALAQRVALAHPERIERVVLSSTFARVVTPPGSRARRWLEQPLVLAGQRLLPERLAAPLARRLAAAGAWVYDPRCDDAVLAFVRFAIRHAPVRDAATLLRLALAHDARASIATLAAPALVVVGECEGSFARAAAAGLAAALPRATSAVLPGVGHLHPLSAPGALAAAIDAWWTRAAT